MALAGVEYGLMPTAHRGSASELSTVPMPAIIWWRQRHFMVLEGIRQGRFHVNDPARGRYSMTEIEFERGYSGVAISWATTSTFTRAGHAFQPIPALLSRAKGTRAATAFTVIAGFLLMLLALLIAPLTQSFVNGVLGASNRSLIPGLVAALAIVGLFRGGLTLLQVGVASHVQAWVSVRGSSRLVSRLLRLDMSFYLERNPGDLSHRAIYNAQIGQALATQLASAIVAVIGIVGYAALILIYSPSIGLLVLAITAVSAVFARVLVRRQGDINARIIRRQNELFGATTAAIVNIETIVASGTQRATFSSLAHRQSEVVSAQAQLAPSSALLTGIPVLTFWVTNSMILVLGGLAVIDNAFTIGALLAVQILAASLYGPLNSVLATGQQVQVLSASLQALDDVESSPLAPRFTTEPTSAQTTVASLELKDVTFGYSPASAAVVSQVSLLIPPGHRLALVGASGSGKSTLANLACGLLTPWSGTVEVDGAPLAAYPTDTLRRSIAKVDQTIVLFDGSVFDNVTMWDPATSEDEVVQALRDAAILEDVLARRGGLHAHVEEGGRNFSGGQCQRLEIARALVAQPRILILDEATSALDDDLEARIDEGIRGRGIATMVIAHRLSTTLSADEIVVLGRGGVVVERGTPAHLTAASGAYSALLASGGGVGRD
jgi:ABC-type bacteriocin/lantibiotic exporter with double-glycine peptidase domain